MIVFKTPTFSRPVRIEDFAEHVAQMSRDSEFHFSEEYELLKNVGCGQSNSAAEAPVNRAKNRFTNILPYDHSRVKLVEVDEEDGSDYINANFMPVSCSSTIVQKFHLSLVNICHMAVRRTRYWKNQFTFFQGFSSRREFIAAQGPLPSTRDAFWQVDNQHLEENTHYCPILDGLGARLSSNHCSDKMRGEGPRQVPSILARFREDERDLRWYRCESSVYHIW